MAEPITFVFAMGAVSKKVRLHDGVKVEVLSDVHEDPQYIYFPTAKNEYERSEDGLRQIREDVISRLDSILDSYRKVYPEFFLYNERVRDDG